MKKSKAVEKAKQTRDFEILFKDSPEYFVIEGAKMLQEGALLTFVCFDESGKFKERFWYPIVNIHRIKSY